MVGNGAIKTAIAARGAAWPHSSRADDMMGLGEASFTDEAAAAAAACTKAEESFRIIAILLASEYRYHTVSGSKVQDGMAATLQEFSRLLM